jgi:hypothetical protein
METPAMSELKVPSGYLIGTYEEVRGYPMATTFMNVIETTTPGIHWVKPLFTDDTEIDWVHSYFIQDTRSYVGNCPMWWGKDHRGYTADIDLAGRYSFDEAMKIHNNRDTDLPWKCTEIERIYRRTVDAQDMDKIRNHAQQKQLLKMESK